ncbi:hypothetical protein [Streptomyces adustus]
MPPARCVGDLVAAVPLRQASTLSPIVDAVRQAGPSHTDVAGLGLSAPAGTLRPLFPEWADVLPHTPERLADAGAVRHRLLTHERLSLKVNRMTALLELGEESGWALVPELGGDVSEPQLAADPGQALALAAAAPT